MSYEMTDMSCADVEVARLEALLCERDAQIATLITERDLLKRGVATVTFGDADAVIAKLVAQRNAAYARIDALYEELEEAQTLRDALQRLRDCDWTIGRGDRMDAVRDIARDALAPRPQELQP